jgi:hypothetical protein
MSMHTVYEFQSLRVSDPKKGPFLRVVAMSSGFEPPNFSNFKVWFLGKYLHVPNLCRARFLGGMRATQYIIHLGYFSWWVFLNCPTCTKKYDQTHQWTTLLLVSKSSVNHIINCVKLISESHHCSLCPSSLPWWPVKKLCQWPYRHTTMQLDIHLITSKAMRSSLAREETTL